VRRTINGPCMDGGKIHENAMKGARITSIWLTICTNGGRRDGGIRPFSPRQAV
jgi:hypothetical protein